MNCSLKLETWVLWITIGSREIPGREGLWQERGAKEKVPAALSLWMETIHIWCLHDLLPSCEYAVYCSQNFYFQLIFFHEAMKHTACSIGASCKTTWSVLGCPNQETVTHLSNLVGDTQHVTVLRNDLYCVWGAQLSTYSKMFVPCTPTEAQSALKNCAKYLPNDCSTLGRHLLTFHKYSYECNGNYEYWQVSATACSKNIMLLSLFFSCKQPFWKYCRSGLGILKNWCSKMRLWGTKHPIWWCIVFVVDFSGPEEINGNCGKMTCRNDG